MRTAYTVRRTPARVCSAYRPFGPGVYGYSAVGSAGFFEGNLVAYYVEADDASAGVKAFRIDHPQDPAGKILMHSCVESNERKLVYDGVVTTDARARGHDRAPELL